MRTLASLIHGEFVPDGNRGGDGSDDDDDDDDDDAMIPIGLCILTRTVN